MAGNGTVVELMRSNFDSGVYRDSDYFQFFTAVVAGSAMSRLHGIAAAGISLAQFRRAIAELVVEQIRHVIESGEAPLDDRTVAIELFPDVEAALKNARGQDDRELEGGEVLDRWQRLS